MKRRIARKVLSLVTAVALVFGLAATAYASNDALTRAEMVGLLVEGAGLADQAAAYAARPSAFQDVAEGSAYEGHINLAYEKGWISGVGNDCFLPDNSATQLQAASVLLRCNGTPAALLKSWPADYSGMAVDSGLTAGVAYSESASVSRAQFQQMLDNAASLAGRPYIGITWKSNAQNYDSFKTVIRAAGGIPVELGQVTSSAVGYGADGAVLPEYLEASGMLKQTYADQIKAKDLSRSNAASVMAAIDGVFFTGGEDISPSLYAVPQAEANNGEEINATRDISDYTLMAYCFANDVPTFAACRGMQMMSIVSGSGFIQDIPNYYEAKGKTYDDTHRMPPDAPNRTYARHDVEILTDKSLWLYDVVAGDTLANVSSWHHQGLAPEMLEGTDLTLVAKTTLDGLDIVEGVEKQSKTFCMGVQFHPENDCANALHNNDPAGALCDVDICLTFFETLVGYAADKPVIGISWGGDPDDYVDIQDIVRNVGGVVTHLPQITSYDQAVKALERVDGIIVTGGEDINPDLYGEEHSPLLEDNNDYRDLRDTSDYNLIKAAVATNEPMLAICRGMQMLNVTCGGGLIQDLPTYLGKEDAEYKVHRNRPNWARHDIAVEKGSKWLEDIIGGTELANVASWHHQVANPERVGEGLTVVSYGPDEVIEAVEYQANDFALGVQFHPEADALGGDGAVCDPAVAQNFFAALVQHAK
ncbi:MAG: C26 family cysteine hydrolase domain-containing family [Lawsonibacter sp.]|nr:C26 family cysteine hydrolase domain-containing family [Lawsonibacter sp.]